MKRPGCFSHSGGVGVPRLSALALGLLLVGGAVSIASAQGEISNPFVDDAEALEHGATFFRLGCSLCHGVDAKGTFRGPDLTEGRWLHGSSDAEIFRNITQGIPGTEMVANDWEEDETWMIIAYVRSLRAESRPPLEGDARVGEHIFFEESDCSQCHMIKGRGGRLGPDLSRIGASRSPDKLREAIRQPDANVSLAYDHVIVTTKDGRRLEGVIKNEDTFSIQMMAYGEELHFFFKDELENVSYRAGSVMPTYNRRSLGDEELRDLVAYLDGLRGE